MASIHAIGTRLIDWRQFPNYQLERRVDIFVTFYLADILNSYFSKNKPEPPLIQSGAIIPEFPLKEQDISNPKRRNLSIKADYMVWNSAQVILIEFKTAQKSYKKSQIVQMMRRAINWRQMVADIETIRQHSSEAEAYHFLQTRLPNLNSPDIVFICLLPTKPPVSASLNGRTCYYVDFQTIITLLRTPKYAADVMAGELANLLQATLEAQG